MCTTFKELFQIADMDEGSLVGTPDKLTYQEAHIANMKIENMI